MNRYTRNMQFITGISIMFFFALVALFAPIVAPFDPFGQELLFGLSGPDGTHILGRDLLGRDIFSRIVYGSRVSLMVGFIAVTVNASIGITVGSIAGAAGGKVDETFMRIIDIVLAFPGLLLAISIMAVLGPGLENVIVALCLTGWVTYARITRAQILALREREFVAAATAYGATTSRLILRHYLPNATAPLIIEAAFNMAAVITAEAGLSFLGLGIQPPAPSWGAMLNEGRSFLLIAPHLTAFPGLCLMLLVFGINLAGDGLRDILDPRSNGNN